MAVSSSDVRDGSGDEPGTASDVRVRRRPRKLRVGEDEIPVGVGANLVCEGDIISAQRKRCRAHESGAPFSMISVDLYATKGTSAASPPSFLPTSTAQ